MIVKCQQSEVSFLLAIFSFQKALSSHPKYIQILLFLCT